MIGRISHKLYNQAVKLAAASTLLLSVPVNAVAAGTTAGTIINNAATVDFFQDGIARKKTSNVVTMTVDDKVAFTLVAIDATGATITPGGKAYLTYILTNTGNAPHDFTLNAAVTGTPGFTPAAGPGFFADAAGTTQLPADPNATGLPYVTNLGPDSSRTIYLQVTAPAQLSDGQSVKYLVTAEAYQPANLGTVNPPVKSSTQAALDAPANKTLNPTTRFVVLADSHGNGGDGDRDGRYSVIARDGKGAPIGFDARSATVAVVKGVTVSDLSGGTQAYRGATLHYSLGVTATGAGTALGVIVTDTLPSQTTYVPGTLKLNGTTLSDAADSDAGDVGGTAAGTVTVKVGNIDSAIPAQVITFDVKID